MIPASTSAGNRSPWFLRQPSPRHLARLFCFPYSGVGASSFQGWPTTIGDVEVCPLQFPGRENRMAEPHYGTYQNLAAALVEPLVPQLDRPFAFFGHCSGALAAFETALVLAQLGLPGPACLFVSGQRAPDDAGHDRLLTMAEPDLRAGLESVARGRGIEPRPDMLDMGMAVLRRDIEAHRGYRRPEPIALSCPIVVLHWRDDPEVSLEQLGGWSRYADSVDVRVVAGGHYDFLGAPDELMRLVTRWR
ncbi:thioesterase II family protein [Amycolatopsis sp. NPDC059027]|uniref:thioesterase II family protein n=1 Tax=unclassified Amycolatopsis TaxID=2618356 RepID=UPI00366E7D07